MYQILCDGDIIHDPRDEELVVLNPRCKLKTNTIGEASFDILPNHPHYGMLQKLHSLFEIRQDNYVLFRGRMVEDTSDIYNVKSVELEGILGVTNGSYIPPFVFPDNFIVPANQNVVEVLLKWFIDKHNEQVQDWQKLKVGTVTVTDKNNVIVRSSDSYLTTWECLEKKLFGSTLGGKLCIRYEADGNYIDYLSDYTLANTQTITLGENLLDIVKESSGVDTFSAILPIGGDVGEDDEQHKLTIQGLPDGDLSSDFVKKGLFIYSKSAVEQYGWIVASIDNTTWDDVYVDTILQSKAVEALSEGLQFLDKVTFKALDLHFTDDEIQSFKMYRKVLIDSPVHGIVSKPYDLDELDIDLNNPQDTEITIGKTDKTLGTILEQKFGDSIEKVEKVAQIAEQMGSKVEQAKQDAEEAKQTAQGMQDGIDEVKDEMLTLETNVLATAESIILGAMQDYVRTGDFSDFQQTVSSQLKIMADEISLNFTKTSNNIQTIDGDVQNRFEQWSRFIKFSADTALTLGTGEGEITLELDPVAGILFKKNGVQFGWWDGVDFHTGNIIVNVNEKAQFGDFAFIPRSDRSLMFLKVAGGTDDEETEEQFVPTPNSGGGDNTPEPQFSYTVDSVSGISYPFTLNASGYYESTNKGQSNSVSMCRINCDAPSSQSINIYFIHSGESTYDFGTIGTVDTTLNRSQTTDSNVLFIGNSQNKHMTTEQSVSVTIPQGQHFIEVKYVKDNSVDNAPDSIAFRIEVG